MLALALTWIAPVQGQEVDTFHLRLYQDGAELAAVGQFDEAVPKLRLACFGMLEAPKVLAPCLGRLLAAQESAGVPDDEIETTVDRLLEVERRFKGWSEPDSRFAVSEETRRRVDSLFVRFGTAESLARVPGLGDVALQKQVTRVAALPVEERRRELNLLVQRQARVPIWHVMSAELALEEGDPRAAAAAASQILSAFEGNAGARCVLGRARAAQELCDASVIEDLGFCPATHLHHSEIELARLDCLVEGGRWSEADTVWQRLPAEVRSQRPVRRQRRQIDKGLEAEARGGAAGAITDDMEATDETLTRSSGDSRPTATPVYAPPPGVAEEELLVTLAPPGGGQSEKELRDEKANEGEGVSPSGGPPPVDEAEVGEAATTTEAPPAPAPMPAASQPSPRTDRPEVPDAQADFGDLPGDEREILLRVRDALATEQRHLYAELWPPVRKVAKRQREFAAAQRLAGSLAFRLGRWRDATRFLQRDPSLASTRPLLQLELAVALHYQGQHEQARGALKLCLPLLDSSAWVEFWTEELKS